MRFIPGQHVHFVGIGGVGLSAIARVLLERQFKVSGSDRSSNALTAALARDGATIYEGHAANYVDGADMLIVSSAIPVDHVEINAACEQGIPVYKRRDIIAALMHDQKVIAVAGTHGKTTTTSMIVHILRECGRDPSYIVGGIMKSTGTNAGVGQDAWFVIEADEYDNMFHGLRPDVIVLNNIEYDHPDFFETPEAFIASFERFAELLSKDDGALVACIDDAIARSIADQRRSRGQRVFTFGLNEDADCRAANIHIDSEGHTCFEVISAEGVRTSAQLSVPGVYNVLNALAALLVTTQIVELPIEQAISALETFENTGRRFEVRGEANGVTVVDDYAHHPTEIKATLDAARARYPRHVIWAVWQPHTYSRTQRLLGDYAAAFSAADHVIVTDIYAAREQPIPGVNGASVAAEIKHAEVHHVPGLDDAVALLIDQVKAPATIVIMSAGDAPRIGEDFLKHKRTNSCR